MSGRSTIDEVRALASALGAAADPTLAAAARAVAAGLDQPFRLAIAGRVKAGKSTLLNAIVGEPLAPTDAGECTRVVTWYRHGIQRGAVAEQLDGHRSPAPMTKGPRGPVVELPVAPTELRKLEITWPSSRLETVTLIDTPGIGAIDGAAARRSVSALADADDGGDPVDAVVFLTNQAHPDDWRLLEAFTDDAGVRPDPACSIALLSRADEIAGGTAEALTVAGALAATLATNPAVRRHCHSIEPVAALLAAGAGALDREQLQLLSSLATHPDADEALRTAQRFVDGVWVDVASPVARLSLVEQLGLFGVRLAVATLRDRPGSTGTDVVEVLRRASGLDRLTEVVDRRFLRRRDALRCRRSLRTLRAAASLAGDVVALAEIERIEANDHTLTELEILAEWGAGRLSIGATDGAELVELLDGDAAANLGGADLHDAIDRWRRRAEHPFAGPKERTAAQVVLHTLERRLIAG